MLPQTLCRTTDSKIMFGDFIQGGTTEDSFELAELATRVFWELYLNNKGDYGWKPWIFFTAFFPTFYNQQMKTFNSRFLPEECLKKIQNNYKKVISFSLSALMVHF